jgi:hypothetical protein
VGYIRSEHTAALACISLRTLEHPLPSLGQPDSSGTPSPDDKVGKNTISTSLCNLTSSLRHGTSPTHTSVTNHRPSTTLLSALRAHDHTRLPNLETMKHGNEQDDRGRLNPCDGCPSDQTRVYVHKRNFGKRGSQRNACPACLPRPSVQPFQIPPGYLQKCPSMRFHLSQFRAMQAMPLPNRKTHATYNN